MSRWIIDVQGYREILDADGNPVQRRKTLQVVGATVTDDGEVTVIEVPPGATGASGATGPTGATGAGGTNTASALVREDFMAVSPGLTADGVFWGDGGPWTFDLIAGTADVGQRSTLQANHPGQAIITTGPSTGEWSIAYGASNAQILFEDFKKATFVWRTSATFSSTTAGFGIAATLNPIDSAASGAYFFGKPATSANWRAKTRDSAVETANVDTGVALAGSTYQVFEIEKNISTRDLTFKINGSTVATVVAATHAIDDNDAYKLGFYYLNGNAGVSSPVIDLVLLETETLDRTAV